MVESTVPTEDFNRIPPFPTVMVGLLRSSKLGEGVLGGSGGGISILTLGTSLGIVPNRASTVMDRGPKGGLESLE